MTGQITHAIPILIAVLVANTILAGPSTHFFSVADFFSSRDTLLVDDGSEGDDFTFILLS